MYIRVTTDRAHGISDHAKGHAAYRHRSRRDGDGGSGAHHEGDVFEYALERIGRFQHGGFLAQAAGLHQVCPPRSREWRRVRQEAAQQRGYVIQPEWQRELHAAYHEREPG